jgi:hypothetical protein
LPGPRFDSFRFTPGNVSLAALFLSPAFAPSAVARAEPEQRLHVGMPARLSMAFEHIQAEIGVLLTRMQNEPADRHELYLQIMQKLNELKAYGMPLPADLVELEGRLEMEFQADQAACRESGRIDEVSGKARRRRRQT